MGRILIFSAGPNAYEAGVNKGESKQAGWNAPPEDWVRAALPRIAEEKPAAVYYCDTPGTRECAEMISMQIEMGSHPLPGLENEIDPGWKGMSAADHAMMESGAEKEAAAPDELKLPFAESAVNLRSALASSLDGLAKQHRKEAIVIVSHRMLTVLMALHLLHMGNRHYRQVAQEFGALNLFEVRAGMPSVLYLNDTCHLHGLILG